MTYEAIETSAQDGSPVELYEFEVDGVTYRYTSGDVDYLYALNTYLATPIERSALEDTTDLPKNDLRLEVVRDFPVAELFRVAPPAGVVLARLIEVHRSDGDQEGIVKWNGRILNVNWEGAKAVLYCENDYTSLKRPGLRRTFGRSCPHVLYGSTGCRLVAADFAESIILSSVSGVNLSSSDFDSFEDGFFDGGYVEWEREPGIFDRRSIRSHVGADVVLTHGISDLEAGTTITAYPGCDHTYETCETKFDNRKNYGGFPNVPKLNPFGPSSVF